jgi:hypothetical protein
VGFFDAKSTCGTVRFDGSALTFIEDNDQNSCETTLFAEAISGIEILETPGTVMAGLPHFTVVVGGTRYTVTFGPDELPVFKVLRDAVVAAWQLSRQSVGDLASQLLRLNQLHRDGTLSDREFTMAKTRLLAG